jgi:hypothetical protein
MGRLNPNFKPGLIPFLIIRQIVPS